MVQKASVERRRSKASWGPGLASMPRAKAAQTRTKTVADRSTVAEVSTITDMETMKMTAMMMLTPKTTRP